MDVLGATIAPGKADGNAWDLDLGASPPLTLMNEISSTLRLPDPASELLKIIASPASAALAKPDVFGTAELRTANGSGETRQLRKVQDSFTPSWTAVSFGSVPLDGSTRIRITLVDADLQLNDSIGTFDVQASDIETAIARGKLHNVVVADQTNRQVLLVSVSAFLERP